MPQDQDAVLDDYRGWLRATAARLNPHLAEDLAQEGWIEMWRALRTFDADKGTLPGWLTYKAYRRMLTCVQSEAWLGRSHPYNLGRGRRRDIVEYPLSSTAPLWDMLAAADIVDDVIWAYHRGRILEAVNQLTPAQRRYVVLRFWHGYNYPDLVAAFGYDPQSLWSSPRSGARRKLRQSLAPLAG